MEYQKNTIETIEISVVMPCLDEEETIETCIKKVQNTFKSEGIKGEIIISDNGSKDRSMNIAKSLDVKVVQEQNKGYGFALQRGFLEAKGKYIIMGDADDSYDWNDIPIFLNKLREGYDFVMGTRLKGKIKKGAMPFLHRYIGNPVLSWILRKLFNGKFSDAHCGLRAFTNIAMQKMDLRTGGMEFASEMAIKASLLRLNTIEIPITLYPDGRTKPPHLKPFRDGWRHLRYMLIMFFQKHYLMMMIRGK